MILVAVLARRDAALYSQESTNVAVTPCAVGSDYQAISQSRTLACAMYNALRFAVSIRIGRSMFSN